MDKFVVPEESKGQFLEAVHRSAAFLRTLPGFVEGFVYVKTDGESRHNVVTTAVWKDEQAFENAKKSAAEGFLKIGFNPPEIMKALNVQIERGVYNPVGVLTGAVSGWRGDAAVLWWCPCLTDLLC